MGAPLNGWVAVGVDGSDQAHLAVRYAAAAAARLGCGVTLVHAMPEVLPMAPMMPLVGVETFAEAGRAVLQRARHVAEEAADGPLEVDEVLRAGSPAHLLVSVSERARLVVVGRRERTALARLLVGSTGAGVATRAHCPMVSVPAAWAGTHRTEGVVVGVEDPERAFEVLATGFAEADRLGSPLVLMHTWKLPPPYDDVLADRVDAGRWRAEAARALEEAARDLAEDHPAVEVRIDVRHQDPAVALLGASEGAALLVLGRHGRGAPFGFHLGSVTRTLMREARCPVEVTPLRLRPGGGLSDELGLSAGELAPQT